MKESYSFRNTKLYRMVVSQMTKEIIASIEKTKSRLAKPPSLPAKQGIYAFFINHTDDLGIFGGSGQLIYIGLSGKNLNSRDVKTHLTSEKTGRSTLRRSIGAILKKKLKLTAIARDKNSIKLRADKYKFNESGEHRLTEWMLKNLMLGYWTPDISISSEKLRSLEEKTIIRLKPTLDLDKRTKRFNPLAEQLDKLRGICRNEVKNGK